MYVRISWCGTRPFSSIRFIGNRRQAAKLPKRVLDNENTQSWALSYCEFINWSSCALNAFFPNDFCPFSFTRILLLSIRYFCVSYPSESVVMLMLFHRSFSLPPDAMSWEAGANGSAALQNHRQPHSERCTSIVRSLQVATLLNLPLMEYGGTALSDSCYILVALIYWTRAPFSWDICSRTCETMLLMLLLPLLLTVTM